jgi:hypothetical protein
MKSRKLVCVALITFAVMAISLPLVAQERHASHHHYKLIDVGTFGGPGGGICNPSCPSINNQGALVGISATSIPDPFAPNMCFFDCFVSLGFVVQDSVVTPLPPLPSGQASATSPSQSRREAGSPDKPKTDSWIRRPGAGRRRAPFSGGTAGSLILALSAELRAIQMRSTIAVRSSEPR